MCTYSVLYTVGCIDVMKCVSLYVTCTGAFLNLLLHIMQNLDAFTLKLKLILMFVLFSMFILLYLLFLFS